MVRQDLADQIQNMVDIFFRLDLVNTISELDHHQISGRVVHQVSLA